MQQRAAFTLVELSIVLVILGLLVGGVLAGQSLIRSAELRAITAEHTQITTALNAFREKYFALPGDMPNAYAFWQSSGVAGCATNTADNAGGCNGDGDGRIDSGDSGMGIPNEFTKVAMHFALAGLVEGNYDGLGDDPTPTNSMRSKINGANWEVHDGGQTGVADNTNPGYLEGGIYITLKHIYPLSDPGGIPGLTHGEAWTIDTKVDDGKGNIGTMRGYTGVLFGFDSAGDCNDQDTDGNATNGNEDYYSLAAYGEDAGGDCQLSFIYRK